MRGWAGSSRRDWPSEAARAGHRSGCPGRGVAPGGRDLTLALLLVCTLAAGLGVGCAARRAVPAPAPAPSPPVPGQAATPTVPGNAPSGSSSDAFPPLPGTNRLYPSQDPRNRATPDAPEAFPLPGAVSGSIAENAVAESGEADSVAESEDADSVAGSAVEDALADPVGENPVAESVDGDTVTGAVAEGATAEKPVAVAPPSSAAWSVQLLASSSLSVARERAGALAPYFPEPLSVRPVAGLFKVRVGRCATRGEAEALRRKALDLGLRDAFVVPAGPGGETPQ
jgi:hypothetical protein